MTKFLVTGSTTMLGKAAVQFFSKDNEVLTPSHKDMNIISEQETLTVINNYMPDVVIHCAEMGDIKECESKPLLAQMTNVTGAFNVAVACKACGSSMVLMSTDHVFDGTRSQPYNIDDNVNPINVYGKTKATAEDLISSVFDNYHIVRTGYLFGNGDNIIHDILTSKQADYECSAHHFVSPTYVQDVVFQLGSIIYAQYGVYHVSNAGFATEYQLAKEAVHVSGVTKDIKPAHISKTFPMSTYRVMHSKLRTWREALKSYIDDIKDGLSNQ